MGALLIDVTGRCLRASRELADRLGTNPDAMRDRGWIAHIEPSDRRLLQSTFRAGGLECGFVRYIRLCVFDGAPCVLVRFRPIFSLTKQLVGYIGIAKQVALAVSREPQEHAG
jgi:hypothetical protein